jgi:hypothetical protein
MLLQVQLCCYRYSYVAIGTVMLLQVQLCCYRYSYVATGTVMLLQVQFTLQQAMKDQRGSKGTDLLFL